MDIQQEVAVIDDKEYSPSLAEKILKMLLPEKLLSVKEEIKSYQFWKAVRCEFLVTLIFVFVGCGSTTAWERPPKDLEIAFAFGLATATLVQCVGHISGAHINPAVTIAMLVTGNISVLRALIYMIAQCIGAIAGTGILYGVTPVSVHGNLGATVLHKDVGKGQAFGVEFMITFLLTFTYFANLEPKRADMGSRSLSVGFAVTLGHLFAYNYTGASMNPARSLGPAVILNIWQDHWVFWVGPILGGILGGFTYEYTQDSTSNTQHLRRSFRRKPATMKRSRSNISENSTSTELTFTTQSEHFRI